MSPALPYSIGHRLSVRLFLLTLAVLGVLCAGIYAATWAVHERAQQRLLAIKENKLAETAQQMLRAGDERFARQLQANAQRRPGTRLSLRHADGAVFYEDPGEDPHLLSAHTRSRDFELRSADGAVVLAGRFAIDVEQDAQILRSVAVVLLLATLLGASVAALIARLAVRHGLRPLRHITRQTEQISAGRSPGRLTLKRPVAELQPWMDQFNGLMDRMEGSYAQLEAFNADVAHELRTPLTSLIGKTELALSRERGADELGDTLASNLEELQRMAALVNDMLFLSKSDRGATARRGAPVHLRDVVGEVVEFHEADATERGLALEVVGDLEAPVDEPLVKRAVSNLLSNATRHAADGTTVRVLIDRRDDGAGIAVENLGRPVPGIDLPRLFDRFYRADPARSDSDAHHGLGLSIVAAIARMHGGRTFAQSDERSTRIGFSIGMSTQGG